MSNEGRRKTVQINSIKLNIWMFSISVCKLSTQIMLILQDTVKAAAKKNKSNVN